MYTSFYANLNIQGKGGVVASPDRTTPGGTYYWHWMRDAALSMRTFIEIHDSDYNQVKYNMNQYLSWVSRV